MEGLPLTLNYDSNVHENGEREEETYTNLYTVPTVGTIVKPKILVFALSTLSIDRPTILTCNHPPTHSQLILGDMNWRLVSYIQTKQLLMTKAMICRINTVQHVAKDVDLMTYRSIIIHINRVNTTGLNDPLDSLASRSNYPIQHFNFNLQNIKK